MYVYRYPLFNILTLCNLKAYYSVSPEERMASVIRSRTQFDNQGTYGSSGCLIVLDMRHNYSHYAWLTPLDYPTISS